MTPEQIIEPQITQQTSPNERQSSSWDIRNAPRNYASLVALQIASAFFSFAAVWLITRYFGPEGFGSIIAFVAASQLVQVFLNWSSTALARFGIEEFVETGKITRSFWVRSWIFFPNLFLILSLFALWLRPLANAFHIPDEVAWLMIAHIVTSSIWFHVQYALQGVKMLRLQGFLLTIERLAILISLSFLIVTSNLQLQNILWAYILPPAFITVIGLVYLRRFIDLRSAFDRSHFKEMLKFSLPLIPFSIVGYLSTSQLDAFFITQYLSTRDLGIFAVATQINGILLQLPIIANTILLSLFISFKTADQESMLDSVFADVVPTATLVWGAFCVFLAFSGAFFLPMALGSEFQASANVLWVLTTSSVLIFPILMGMATLSNTYSKTYISMYASVLSAVVHVVFNIFLISRFGIIGCAWATVLSSLSSLCVFSWLLKREGLLPGNWIFLSVIPGLAGALCLTSFGNVYYGALTFSVITLAVVAAKAASVKRAVGVVRGRLKC